MLVIPRCRYFEAVDELHLEFIHYPQWEETSELYTHKIEKNYDIVEQAQLIRTLTSFFLSFSSLKKFKKKQFTSLTRARAYLPRALSARSSG